MKTADLSVLKVNEKDEPLAGATFEILKEDGTETGLKADTDDTGEVTFTGLTVRQLPIEGKQGTKWV